MCVRKSWIIEDEKSVTIAYIDDESPMICYQHKPTLKFLVAILT